MERCVSGELPCCEVTAYWSAMVWFSLMNESGAVKQPSKLENSSSLDSLSVNIGVMVGLRNDGEGRMILRPASTGLHSARAESAENLDYISKIIPRAINVVFLPYVQTESNSSHLEHGS